MKRRILVIAPDTDLRHSLEFALAAEGYDVRWRSNISPLALSERADCVVLDHHATGPDLNAAIAFCTAAAPVILLANTAPHPLSHWTFRTVLKPLLGPALTGAIRDAIDTQATTK